MTPIDANTTLFLDRDGVLNDESKKHYVTSIDEFIFLPTVLDALAIFAQQFNRIIIVTNQRVVGRGIITELELQNIHQHMLTKINTANGRIDAVYYCAAVADTDSNRKPNTGMALQAKKDFPEIDFTNSIIIGNSMSDMEFGNALGMKTFFVKSTKPSPTPPHPKIDQYFNNLLEVVNHLLER